MANYSMKDLTQEQREIAEKNGIKYNTLVKRLVWGWSIEEAIGSKTRVSGGRKANVIQEDGKELSHYWHGERNTFLKCPHPDCSHIAEIITKAHCRINHGMELNEVAEKYGMPEVVRSKGDVSKETADRSKWYSVSSSTGVL